MINIDIYTSPQKLEYQKSCERLQELDYIEQYRNLTEAEKAEFTDLIIFINETEKVLF